MTTIEPLIEQALERRAGGDFPAAEALLRQAAEIDPREPTPLYLLGLLRLQAGAAAQAIPLLQQVVALRPAHLQARLTLANVFQLNEDFDLAADVYRHACDLDPSNLPALIGLSQSLLSGGEAAEALSAAERATALEPDNSESQMARGAALSALGRKRSAAEAWRAAVALEPNSAHARLRLAMDLVEIDELEEALSAAQAATALDESAALGWFVLGTVLRRLACAQEAIEALERSVRLDATGSKAHLDLGLAYAALERLDLAETAFRRAIELDPAEKQAHASLSSLYCSCGQMQPGRAHALRALEIDPTMAAPHQNLARILGREGRHAEARRHRDAAYGACCYSISRAPRASRSVLILAATDTGNVPDRYLLPANQYNRIHYFVEYSNQHDLNTLPPHDVVFNAIGDEDELEPLAADVAEVLAAVRHPVLNPPDRIVRTRRDLAPTLFAGIEGLVIPKVARLGGEVEQRDPSALFAQAGAPTPVILRTAGAHGGKGLKLVSSDQLRLAALTDTQAHYATAFHDFRSADGFYRKYRIIFVDREPYPYHLAIGSHWIVHYESSGMAHRPEHLDEERAFLADPEAALGDVAMSAIRAVGRRMNLDFGGVDFTVLEDGRALLFEANATMLAHPEAADGPLAHKNPYAQRIFSAFQQRVEAVA